MDARSSAQSVSVSVKVIRANGRVEDQGKVAYWDKNYFKRMGYILRHELRPRLAERNISLGRYLRDLFMGNLGATLMVNKGRDITTARLRAVGTEPLTIAWGTGAGTTAAADTTLFTEALVNMTSGTTDHTAGTSSQITTTTTNDTYQVTGTRTATASGTVTNAGLWDAASGGSLYMKGDFAGIALANGDSITFTIKVQYS